MKNKFEQFIESLPQKYLLILLLHAFIGITIFEFPALSKIYAFLILFTGIVVIVKNKNRNNEVLIAAAYVVGAEVFLRMTHGSPNYEFGKYVIILFALLGMYFNGFSKKAAPYWVFMLLLLPGIIISVWQLHAPIREKIIFDILGPVSLAIFSVYAYNKPLALRNLDVVLLALGLPIISCCTYLFLYSPTTQHAFFNTQSSFIMSGNFGPNQVATLLGLGAFIFFSRFILKSASVIHLLVNLLIASCMAYRGLLTFSRGGILTAIVMIVFLMIFVLLDLKYYAKFQIKYKLIFCMLSFIGIFLLTSYESRGLLANRYTNKDVKGHVKRQSVYGRQNLGAREINMFIEHPILGNGAGKGKQDSIEQLGKRVSTHNEITRMLSEHGLFGIAGLLILIIAPILLVLKTKPNVYFLSFYLFWLLTITHTGMRIAAPSFLYALTLLQIQSKRSK